MRSTKRLSSLKRNLDLYDLCIEIDNGLKNSDDLAEKFGISSRQIDRKIHRLKELGIRISTTNPFLFSGEASKFSYKLEERIVRVLDKLDRILEIPELYKESRLSEEEQEEAIDMFTMVNSNGKHWPQNYFKDLKKRRERLRVIIPFALENIIKKDPDQVTETEIKNIGLISVLNKYYGGSILKFLQVSSPWLQRRDMNRSYNIKKSQIQNPYPEF